MYLGMQNLFALANLHQRNGHCMSYAVWPEWAIFYILGNFFKAFGNNYIDQISHILRQFM